MNETEIIIIVLILVSMVLIGISALDEGYKIHYNNITVEGVNYTVYENKIIIFEEDGSIKVFKLPKDTDTDNIEAFLIAVLSTILVHIIFRNTK